ncbi:S-crystallin [Parasponia andersonii]|uniref:S-crystallin n=1 Tax=Parasponia andersonii TaxID=3476 RepID=A0A2P5DF01_PARAD|nr:S-crystallin [Parasponia andersonii]
METSLVLVESFGACKAEGEEKEKAIESAQETLAFLEKEVEGKEVFGGERIGYLDLATGWILLWLNAMEEVGETKLLEAEKFPFLYLYKWSQNFMDDPLIREAIPPQESVVEYFKFIFGYLRSLDLNQQEMKNMGLFWQ